MRERRIFWEFGVLNVIFSTWFYQVLNGYFLLLCSPSSQYVLSSITLHSTFFAQSSPLVTYIGSQPKVETTICLYFVSFFFG